MFLCWTKFIEILPTFISSNMFIMKIHFTINPMILVTHHKKYYSFIYFINFKILTLKSEIYSYFRINDDKIHRVE